MPIMPDIEAEAARALAAVGRDIGHLFHHNDEPSLARHVAAAKAAPQTPAQQPATMAPAGAAPKENHVSLTTIEDGLKNEITQGLDYVLDFAGRLRAAAPGIIATSEAVAGSTVGKLVEAAAGMVLPPAYEQVAVDFVKDLVTKYGQPAQAVAAAPQPQ